MLQNTGSELSTPVSVRRYVEGKLPRVTIGAKDIVSGELGISVTEWDMAHCPEELTTDEVYPSLSADELAVFLSSVAILSHPALAQASISVYITV